MKRLVVLMALAGGAAAAAGVAAVDLHGARVVEPQVVVADGLSRPTDLAVNPKDGSLWIVSYAAKSVTIVDGPGTDAQRQQTFVDRSNHYLEHPNGIAFSPTRDEFATSSYAAGFQGPTLWTADRADFRAGRESHLDMLHETNYATGIDAGADTVRREYWVVNGSWGFVDRYFFNAPHALGADNHKDGLTYRYPLRKEIKEIDDVPTGIDFDPATRILYVADTRNSRVLRLRTDAVPLERGRQMNGSNGETPIWRMPNPPWGTLVTTGSKHLVAPSGLAVIGELIVVADYANGRISAFRRDGARAWTIDSGVGANALTGIEPGGEGMLYALDAARGRVLAVPLPT